MRWLDAVARAFPYHRTRCRHCAACHCSARNSGKRDMPPTRKGLIPTVRPTHAITPVRKRTNTTSAADSTTVSPCKSIDWEQVSFLHCTRSRRRAGVASGDAMPIFDFRCESCGQTFELLVRSDPPLCPHCGGQHVVKMMSAPAAPGKSREIIASARRQAAREGHFSHYSSSEKPRG